MWSTAGVKFDIYFDQGLMMQPISRSNWRVELSSGGQATPLGVAIASPIVVRLHFAFPLHDQASSVMYQPASPQASDVRNERGVPAEAFDFPLL